MLVCPRELWDIPRRRRQSAVPDHVQWMSYLGTLESFHILVHFGCYINHVTFTWWVRVLVAWFIQMCIQLSSNHYFCKAWIFLPFLRRHVWRNWYYLGCFLYDITDLLRVCGAPVPCMECTNNLGVSIQIQDVSLKLKFSWWLLMRYVVGDFLMTRMVVFAC